MLYGPLVTVVCTVVLSTAGENTQVPPGETKCNCHGRYEFRLELSQVNGCQRVDLWSNNELRQQRRLYVQHERQTLEAHKVEIGPCIRGRLSRCGQCQQSKSTSQPNVSVREKPCPIRGVPQRRRFDRSDHFRSSSWRYQKFSTKILRPRELRFLLSAPLKRSKPAAAASGP